LVKRMPLRFDDSGWEARHPQDATPSKASIQSQNSLSVSGWMDIGDRYNNTNPGDDQRTTYLCQTFFAAAASEIFFDLVSFASFLVDRNRLASSSSFIFNWLAGYFFPVLQHSFASPAPAATSAARGGRRGGRHGLAQARRQEPCKVCIWVVWFEDQVISQPIP
jgi:hypothetical protein